MGNYNNCHHEHVNNIQDNCYRDNIFSGNHNHMNHNHNRVIFIITFIIKTSSTGNERVLNLQTRIFATNSYGYLSEVDRILVMKDGQIVEDGTYDELNREGTEFSRLISRPSSSSEPIEDETAAPGKDIVLYCIALCCIVLHCIYTFI